MNNLRHKTKLIIILLVVLVTTINLSMLFTSVKAGPYVPEEHVNNGWHWGVEVGDELYWELEMILTNASSGEVTMMFRDIWIYNITSIENVTIDYLGVNDFSLVNATQCYYNMTEEELEAYDDPSEFALFGYNNSDSIQHKYRAGMGGAPYILPLNGSNNLEVDILDDILNESFYYPLSLGGYSHFDSYSSNIGDNSITFTNSTENFYMYMEYDSTSGVAEYAEGYIQVNMGEPMFINVTMQRVLDYDITDEVEWGVGIGDTIYYDWYDGGSSYYDVKVDIINITDMMLPKSNNGFMEEDISMVYQVVYANLSTWDGTRYEIELSNLPIGLANNFYFQYFDESFSPEFNFLIPNNTLKEDIEFMWNLNTFHIWDAPFDEIELIENGNFEFTLRNSFTNFKVKTTIEKSTGITQSFMIQDGLDLLYYEIKNMTLVDWDLEIGDVVYYKHNSQDGEIYNRATIIATYGEFVNLTIWEEISGGLFTKIPGQPELQFFKTVIAELEEFDEVTGTWQSDGEYIFLEANTYWPISPYAMYGPTIPPLFIPLGFTGEDVEDLLGVFNDVFDEMTFTEDRVNLRNSTIGKDYDIYIDISTGQITFLGGWMNMPGGDDTTWMYMAIYPMHNETLHSGTNSISVEINDAISEVAVANIDIITNNTGIEVVNAILAYNPTNISITNGTVIYYNDLLISNTTGLENITFYIKFDDSFDLDNYNLTFWAWNMSGNNEWEAAPPEATDMFVYDYADNSLTIIFPVGGGSGPISIIMAVSYIYTGSEEAIPGFPFLMLLGFLSLSAIALIIKQKNKVKKL